MSDVLIGQAYHLRFDPKLWREMEPYPPLGSLYAAAVLRDGGYDVAFHDSMLAESEEAWTEAIERERPRYAVLFEDNFNYLSKMCLLRMREAAFRMLGAAHERGCITVVCSSDATDRYDDYLESGADFVLLGEGEASLVELLAVLDESAHRGAVRDDVRGATVRMGADLADVREIAGIAFRVRGKTIATARRPVLRRLDDLPHPARDLIDLQAYRRIWLDRHGRFSINMVTSRGCPFHCNWCAKPIWGQRYNARSPEDVADELVWLSEHVAPDHIWFMDDMMGIQPGWMARFAEAVDERGVRTPFKCLNRVDLLLRDGEIEALRRAGCRTVWTGVESGSQKILDAMDKGISVEQIQEAADRLHSAGVRVGFFLQFGYPGETREDIEMTFELVRRCRPDQIGVSVSYPLPGTPFHDMVQEELGKKQNWVDSDDLAMLHTGPYSTAFYRRLHRALHKEFRARKAFRALRDGLRSPSRLSSHHARETAALVYNAASLPLARWRMERAARLPHDGIGALNGRLSPDAAAVPSPQHVPDSRNLS